MKKRHKVFPKKIWILSVFFVLAAAGVFLSDPENILGVFDSDRAVHIRPAEIENSTLIIGTHLIYLYGLNEELYSLAMDSASASGQSRIYYKSELSDGAWFDITEANSLGEITDRGKKVEEGEIEVLFFTHHTKSDGITYDLLTNQPVCVFDIREHYELENMEELQAVKLQYDMMAEQEGQTDTLKRNLNLVEYFFSTETHTEDTDLYDMQMKALQTYYNRLSGQESQSGLVMHVMEKLDFARRFIVLGIAEGQLEVLLDSVGSTYPDNGETEEVEFTLDNALLTAIGESQSAVGESLAQAQGNQLSQGLTAISDMEYKLSQDLIREAVAENFEGCDACIARLGYLFNITDGVIKDREGELEILDDLKKTAKEEEYEFVLRQIEIRREDTAESSPGEKELTELCEKKELLREKKAKALDDLDIDTANKIEAELVSVNEKIESMDGSKTSDSYSSQAKNITDTKNEILNALEGDDLSDALTASIEKDVDALKSMLDSGSSLAMSSLKEVYAKMVGNAYLKDTKAYDDLLEEIETAIEESDVLAMEQKGGLTLEMAEQVLEELEMEAGGGGNGQDSSQSSIQGESTQGSGQSSIQGGSGRDSSQSSMQEGNGQAALQEENKRKTAQVLGLAEYARETDNSELVSLAEGKAAMLAKDGGYVFSTYEILGENYVPIDLLAEYLGYRYVWNDTKKNGILSRGRIYYSFTAFSDVAEKRGGKDIMGKAAELKGTIYIPASYAKVTFDVSAQEIFGTGYSVLAGEDVTEQSEEVAQALRQRGGVGWE